MNQNFERYHCQMALPGFGIAMQQKLQNAKVLIVGLGGLGCPVAQYLVASGVGTIGLADDDMVSLSNLHRQILYTPDDVGFPKIEVAKKKLQLQNPSINIIPYRLRVESENVMQLLEQFDLIIEGTDNFETKFLINDACVLLKKPLIYGAIYQHEGQVGVWNILQEDGTYSPNYRDVFPDAENALVPNCAEGGVIPSLAGIVGCMQANEAIKYLIGSRELLVGKLWIINMQDGRTHTIKLKKTVVQITKIPETVRTIDWDQLAKLKDYELIDVRTASEHQAFNIGGKNIPLDELENKLSAIKNNVPIVCYCVSGKRSAAAAGLIKKYFPAATVFTLKNGIAATQKNAIQI